MKILFLMMAGKGTRLGNKIPKQFLEIGDQPVYKSILDLYSTSSLIDRVVIVNNPDWMSYVESQVNDDAYPFEISIIKGGETRSASIQNAVKFVNSSLELSDDSVVLIHDATHPYLDTKACGEVISLIADRYKAATVVTHVWDTVYESEDGEVSRTLNRENIAVGASPEAFRWDFLKGIYLVERDLSQFTSAGNYAKQVGEKIGIVWSSKINLKITYPDDLRLYTSALNYFKD